LGHWQKMMLIPEPIDKMGIHALPLAKRGSIKFHPSLSKESGTSQVAKLMQKAAEIFCFFY